MRDIIKELEDAVYEAYSNVAELTQAVMDIEIQLNRYEDEQASKRPDGKRTEEWAFDARHALRSRKRDLALANVELERRRFEYQAALNEESYGIEDPQEYV